MVAGFNKLTWTTRQIIGYVIYCGHCLNNLFLNVKYFFDRDDFQFLCRRFGPKVSFVLSKPVLESRCEIVALFGDLPGSYETLTYSGRFPLIVYTGNPKQSRWFRQIIVFIWSLELWLRAEWLWFWAKKEFTWRTVTKFLELHSFYMKNLRILWFWLSYCFGIYQVILTNLVT